jgi:hypothetical protein
MGTNHGAEGSALYRPDGGWRFWPWIYFGIMVFNAVVMLTLGLRSDGWLRWWGLVFAPLVLAFGIAVLLLTPRSVEVGAEAVHPWRGSARTRCSPRSAPASRRHAGSAGSRRG